MRSSPTLIATGLQALGHRVAFGIKTIEDGGNDWVKEGCAVAHSSVAPQTKITSTARRFHQ